MGSFKVVLVLFHHYFIITDEERTKETRELSLRLAACDPVKHTEIAENKKLPDYVREIHEADKNGYGKQMKSPAIESNKWYI